MASRSIAVWLLLGVVAALQGARAHGGIASHEVDARTLEDHEASRIRGEHVSESNSKHADKMREPEEESEEREHFTAIDMDAACMLLGSVTFVMALFCLVNLQDDDVRRYAWKVISNTISIFMAVMFFQGNNQMLVSYTAEFGLGEAAMVCVHFAHCTLYIIMLMIIVGCISGAFRDDHVDLERRAWTFADAMLVNFEEEVSENRVRAVMRGEVEAEKSVVTDDYGLEVAVVKKDVELDRRMRQNKAWATLLAHMGGFSAIAAGASLQQSQFFRTSPWLCFTPVVITTFLLVLLFQGTQVIRMRLKAQAKAAHRKGRRAALVTEVMSEAENDIMSLAISFNTVQVVRFGITGQLPNAEGLEEPVQFELDRSKVVWIWGCGLIFVSASVLIAFLRAYCVREKSQAPHDQHVEEQESDTVGERTADILMNTTAMSFAWCILWGARWACIMRPVLGLSVTSIDGRIILAIILSAISFVVVYVLDQIDDSLRAAAASTKTAERAIYSIIAAVSVLVGFTWEHSFDGAVSAVASLNEDHERITKFVLGVAVFFLLLFPWRRYILKRSLQLEDLKKKREIARTKRNTSRPVPGGDHMPLLMTEAPKTAFDKMCCCR